MATGYKARVLPVLGRCLSAIGADPKLANDLYDLIVSNDVFREPKLAGEDGGIEVSSGYGANTKMPYVQMLDHHLDWMTQMEAHSARELGLNMIAAAEAAETDGFMMNWVMDTIGVERDQAAGLLIGLREYRENYFKGGGGSEPQ